MSHRVSEECIRGRKCAPIPKSVVQNGLRELQKLLHKQLPTNGDPTLAILPLTDARVSEARRAGTDEALRFLFFAPPIRSTSRE